MKSRLNQFLIVLSILSVVYFFFMKPAEELVSIEEEIVEEYHPTLAYGIIIDSMEVETNVIQRNENLGSILGRHNVDQSIVHRIASEFNKVFDVRRLAAGNPYTVIKTKDSLQTAQFFIYEIDPINYVVFELMDNIKAYRARKEVTTHLRTASGEINSSLYQTLANENLNPALALELSEVFAWSIDFFRIQKGDHFTVVYEERFVEDRSVGVGKIHAAVFNHFGKDNYAFYFEGGDEQGYYDENAQNLKKAFLKAPLEYSRISSRFSMNRFHPVLKTNRPHLGTDYAAPTGTPIRTVGDGVVTEARYHSGNGNYVKVKHNSTYTTQYLHMSRFGAGIKPGVRVKQGQIIGYVGATGLATGPHLCFRFWKNGVQVDPLKEKAPPAEPVKKEHLDEFYTVRDKYMPMLLNKEILPEVKEHPLLSMRVVKDGK